MRLREQRRPDGPQGAEGVDLPEGGRGGPPGAGRAGRGSPTQLPHHLKLSSYYLSFYLYKIEHFYSIDSLAYKLFPASLHSSVP